MSSIAQQAEVQKLARLLGVPPAELAYLAHVPAGATRALRDRITRTLFDADATAFQRIAGASRLLPASISARIAEKAFGPLLCARVSGVVPVESAVAVALELPVPFLADVTVELDPRHVSELVSRIPTATVVQVAAELTHRHEFVTKGRFVDCLSPETIRAVVENTADDGALLRTAFFIEDRAVLARVMASLPEERLRRIVVEAARREPELWPEVLALLTELPPEWCQRLVTMALDGGLELVDALVGAARKHQLLDALFVVFDRVDADTRTRLLAAPALGDAALWRELALCALTALSTAADAA